MINDPKDISSTKSTNGGFSQNPKNCFQSSQKGLSKFVFVSNIISTGLFMALGDYLKQEFDIKYKKSNEEYDWPRTKRMALVGFVSGTICHYYYNYIDVTFPKKNIKHVLIKVILDQMILAPVTISFFFIFMNFLERKTLKEGCEELKSKFVPTYKVDCLIWPPAQIINFFLIPYQFRLLYINTISIVYNMYLSYIKHNVEV